MNKNIVKYKKYFGRIVIEMVVHCFNQEAFLNTLYFSKLSFVLMFKNPAFI